MKASLPFKYIISVKNGKNYVVFDYRDYEGKRKRKWVNTNTPEKCAKKTLNAKVDEIVAEFYKEYCEGALREPVQNAKSEDEADAICEGVRYSFTKFLKSWLASIKPTVAETTFVGYQHKLNSVIAYFDKTYHDIMLDEVKAIHIQTFYNDEFNSGLSANTIKHYHANIHKALKYAVKMNLVSVNESEKTELPKMNKFEAAFYNQNELEQLFRLFRGDRMELVVLIAAYYGLRRSEIIGLKWDSIDFEKKTITIKNKAYNTYENGKVVTKFQSELKNKSSCRTLPLIPYIERMLREKMEIDTHYSKLLRGGYNHKYDEYICKDESGEIITPNYVSDHFRTMIKKNGLKKIRFHDLRHSCASLLLANGVSMKEIQEWLGHSTYHVTADFYSHLDFSSKQQSADTISEALGFGRAEKTTKGVK